MLTDITCAAEHIQNGQGSATALMEQSIATAQSAACKNAFALPLFESALQCAQSIDTTRSKAPEQPTPPLAGLAVSVKDLFDIAGTRSAASSLVLQNAPLAQSDAPAVARLRQAGAALIGRTHMVEFAFSGVGVNPHFGTPQAIDALHGSSSLAANISRAPRVPGGSSSGAAVSVASGAAWAALGSDTGGSIRIPAALNGLVGFKSTARLVPTSGTVPLSFTLDTACAITRSVRDAVLLHEILAARKVASNPKRLSDYRLAVPEQLFFDDIEPAVLHAFERSLRQLSEAGARIERIALDEVNALTTINAQGSFSAAESYAWHRPLLADEQRAALYDPRVRRRIERGAAMSAADYITLMQARQHWIEQMQTAMSGFDALLSPTTPIVAPTIASVAPADGLDPAADAARDEEFTRVNGLLLRNTSVVNMLDGCALSLPCHVAGELPMGLMIWQSALHDDAVLQLSLQVERVLRAG